MNFQITYNADSKLSYTHNKRSIMTDIEKIVKIIENYSTELAAEEILCLFNVSNRRELLIAFLDDIHSKSYEHIKSDEGKVDAFLSNL